MGLLLVNLNFESIPLETQSNECWFNRHYIKGHNNDMMSYLKLLVSLIAIHQYNLYSRVKDMLLNRDSSSAFKGKEHIPRRGRHKAVSQLSVSRVHIPSNHGVLCHGHCYNVVLFASLGLLAEYVVVLDLRKEEDYFSSLMMNIILPDIFSTFRCLILEIFL